MGLTIEEGVSVGHSVVVHCDRVGRGSLLGNNCTILNNVTLGENCLVAANSAVLNGTQVPANSFVTGAAGIGKTPSDREADFGNAPHLRGAG